MRNRLLGALCLVGLAACAPIDDKARMSNFVIVPADDAEDMGRIYRLITDNKLVIAEMRLRELREGAASEITRGLADIAFAEILYRKGLDKRARVLCARYLSSQYDELAADAHQIMAKLSLQKWDLGTARRHFDTARRITREVGLTLRENKAREYVRFTEALVMFDTGAYAEAKEVLTSFTDPELKAIVERLYRIDEE